MTIIADKYGTGLRTAALQFSSALDVVAAVIPRTCSAKQAVQNVESTKAKIPADFWAELKHEKLVMRRWLGCALLLAF